MKQKYSLNIADIQLDVVADAAPAEVEKIAGMLDRKMREIYLHSRSCTKNEAALLCALEFCADRLAGQERLAELEELSEKYSEVLKVIREKNAELGEEVEKLRSENTLLRSLLTDKGEHPTEAVVLPTETVTEAEPAAKPVSAKEFLRQVADAQYGEQPAVPAEENKGKDENPAPAGRRKAGSMFDLLSFDEV